MTVTENNAAIVLNGSLYWIQTNWLTVLKEVGRSNWKEMTNFNNIVGMHRLQKEKLYNFKQACSVISRNKDNGVHVQYWSGCMESRTESMEYIWEKQNENSKEQEKWETTVANDWVMQDAKEKNK